MQFGCNFFILVATFLDLVATFRYSLQLTKFLLISPPKNHANLSVGKLGLHIFYGMDHNILLNATRTVDGFF